MQNQHALVTSRSPCGHAARAACQGQGGPAPSGQTCAEPNDTGPIPASALELGRIRFLLFKIYIFVRQDASPCVHHAPAARRAGGPWSWGCHALRMPGTPFSRSTIEGLKVNNMISSANAVCCCYVFPTKIAWAPILKPRAHAKPDRRFSGFMAKAPRASCRLLDEPRCTSSVLEWRLVAAN